VNTVAPPVLIVDRDRHRAGDGRVHDVVEYFCIPIVVAKCKIRVAREFSLHHLNLESLSVSSSWDSERSVAVQVLRVVVNAVHQVGLHVEDLRAVRLNHVLYVVSQTGSDGVVVANIPGICH